MADNTHIEWTDATWNPITGCSIVSPGCTNCYAMKLAGTRLKHIESRAGLTVDSKAGPVWNGKVRFNEQWIQQPLRWKRPCRIFVCAHGDLFAENVPDAWIDQVFAVMAAAPQHTFQVLTKRAKRMQEYLTDRAVIRRVYELACDWVLGASLNVVLILPGVDPNLAPAGPRLFLDTWPLPNVWLGISAEDQQRAEERVPELLATPAAIRFVSAEPLLGQINFHWMYKPGTNGLNSLTGEVEEIDTGTILNGPKLDWIIVGGESGKDARPMHPRWALSIRDQCIAAGVPFFFKQWGVWTPTSSVDGYWHGPNHNLRQYPDAEGIAWLADGRVALRDFAVAEHRRRIRSGKAASSRAIEVDQSAIDDFHRSMENPNRCADNPTGYQWMYRVGKKRAGRLIDGVEHNAMPQVLA